MNADDFDFVGKNISALGNAMKAFELPVAKNFGNILCLTGDLLSANATAIADANKDSTESTSAIIGREIFGIIGGIPGASIAISLALNNSSIAQLYGLTLRSLLLVPIGAYGAGAIVLACGLIAVAAFGGAKFGEELGKSAFSHLKKMYSLVVDRDPLVIDLDGDGIELTSLGVAGQEGASGIHFDYDRDGFGERTAWVTADDGLLAIDDNGNGLADGIGELFGSPSQDGFAVLETLDTNHDGVISAGDREFSKLRIWRDLNQNGATDAGELQTLDEAGITSISLSRSDVTGTNAGNDRGFQSTVTFAGGATGIAESIYFQTDRAATVDTTPEFTLAEGVDLLPQLGGSGQIHSLAWKASTDAAFRAEWTAAR